MKPLTILEAHTAAKAEQFPDWPQPRVLLAGRSNVGKSSLLNEVTGAKGKIKGKMGARVSNTPGRTRQLHFYQTRQVCLVDLPGYGYAKVPRPERDRWRGLIEAAMDSDPKPALLTLLVDSRHEAKGPDLELLEYADSLSLEMLVVATKVDKLSGNEKGRNLAALRRGLGLSADPLAFSAKTGEGLERLLAILRGLAS